MRLLTGGGPPGTHGEEEEGWGVKERVDLVAWGVVRMASSMSSSMRSSSPELEEESEQRCILLPREPDRCDRSWVPITDHSELEECSVPPQSPVRPPGMFIALLPIVGEESGEAWSARVEWWRLVAAREKSRPRDLRGRMLVGEA